jgi:hypothetical protein
MALTVTDILCQNCVRYPAKLRGNIAIYGDMRTDIGVARSR